MNFIDIHTHRHCSDNEVVVVKSTLWDREYSSECLYSVGIHPWDSGRVSLQEARCWLESHSDAIAVGECGFDFAGGRSELKAQQGLFELQLEYAHSQGLPMLIHCVKGYNELLEMTRDYQKVQFVVHGFNGSAQLAEQLLKRNFNLSFGAMIIRSEKLQNLLRWLPIENILMETDDSSVGIREVYECVGRVKSIEIESLKELIYNNFKRIFEL
jgi:TatD DNase family protein